jgi:hypothetical protein
MFRWHFNSWHTGLLIGLFATFLWVNSTAVAQSPSVTDTLVSRVLGESMLRGNGGGVVQLAEAESINAGASIKRAEASIKSAQAATDWLAVDLARAETFWSKRLKSLSDQLDEDNAKTNLNIGKRQNALNQAIEISKTTESSRQLRQANKWNLMKNHPELSRSAVYEGRGLNFLLLRLDPTMLAYTSSLDQNSEAQKFLDRLRLSPEMIHGLNLKQSSRDGIIIFPADGAGLDTRLWPYLLRAKQFADARETLELAKQDIGAEDRSGQVSFETHEALRAAVAGLQQEFDRAYPAERVRGGPYYQIRHYLESQRFLKDRENELYRLEVTGRSHLNTQRFDPERDGDHLLALLGFMAKYQLEFAPCGKGNEPIYWQVFQMMRDLYSTVNEEQ